MKKYTLSLSVLAAAIFVAYGLSCNTHRQNEQNKTPEQASADSSAVAKKKPVPALANVRVVVSGGYTRPKWSPDGSMLLLTKTGDAGLYYLVVFSEKIEQLNDIAGAGNGAAWSQDGKSIFYNEKDAKLSTVVKSIDIKTKKVSAHPEINITGIQSYALTEGNGPLISLNPTTQKVEATHPVTKITWQVTLDEGPFDSPILSPDRSKVVVHKGSEIFVYHSNSSGLFSRLGKGLATGWSFYSDYILATLTESADAQTVTNSELYVFSTEGDRRFRLTTTPDRMEMWADWNPVKYEIAFADEKTGEIFLGEIVFN